VIAMVSGKMVGLPVDGSPVSSGNGCCEVLDHPAIRDCQPSVNPVAFPDA
jgi:hypothetical protein